MRIRLGIHLRVGERYPDGMSVKATPNPLSIQPRRFSIRLPRPLWIGSVAGVLVVVAVGLPIGVPVYRQYVAIREIEEVGGRVETYARGPKWLRRQFGDCQWMKPFDEVVSV